MNVIKEECHISVAIPRERTRLEPFWASQIIHPTESLLTDWGNEFLHLLAETGAAREHIRIYNQPEEAIRVGDNGDISYDWNRFDMMAESILATGNAVKVVFFGMPYEIARYPESEKVRPNGARVCISPPKDYNLWQQMCSDFTHHVVNQYGEEELKRWSFRCWNEPDLANFWHESDLNEYLKLYDYFAKGVKDVCPSLTVGGPALSSSKTYKNPENITFFLDHVTRGVNHSTGGTGAPIDFLGIHTYGGQSAGGGPGRKYPAVDYMLELHNLYAETLNRYPELKKIPIHVEEWGPSSGGTTGVAEKPMASIRNTEYGAAFLTDLVARHIEMRRHGGRNFKGFTFCASGYEKPPSHDFMGYRTLHTKNGFHKPILNAFKLLNRLGPYLARVDHQCQTPHLTAFATFDEKKLTVVTTNYQFDRIDSAGTECQVSLNIELPLENNDEVRLNHWRINSQHSNAHTAFQDIGAPKNPTPEHIQVVKKRMDLERIAPPSAVNVRNLSEYNFSLPCNAVSLIEIEAGEKFTF